MLIRNALVVTGCIALAGLSVAPSTSADTANRTTYMTFSKPVRLPGAVLGSGTYIFELPDPIGAANVIRVSSRDRKRVYLTAFTRRVDRPAGLPRTQLVSLGEARPDAVVPITAWWPMYESFGHEFIYR